MGEKFKEGKKMKTSFLIILIFIVIVSGCGFKNYEDAENFYKKRTKFVRNRADFQTLPGLNGLDITQVIGQQVS